MKQTTPRTTTALVAGVILGSLLFASAAAAQPPEGEGHGRMGRRFQRVMRELHLDDQTREQVRAILRESRPRARELRRDKRQARRAMRELLEQDSPGEEAVVAMARRLGQIQTELRVHRMRTMLRIHRLLTPEQRRQLRQLRGRRGRRGR